jgi:NAD(P)-dependent dehydrogenase (short-subunit alcohol dehydrogenase family)
MFQNMVCVPMCLGPGKRGGPRNCKIANVNPVSGIISMESAEGKFLRHSRHPRLAKMRNNGSADGFAAPIGGGKTLQTPLAGQIAVVTGSGKGIGAAIARRLAAMGATVVVSGRTRSHLEKVAGEITEAGGKGLIAECDVSQLESVEAMAQKVKSELGGIHVLVNNAGIGGFKTPLASLPPETWDSILNTNLRGVYFCIRAFASLMSASGGGHIVNISSLAGKNALPNGAAYAASKWGLNGMSYSVAEELRGQNIRVSVVCPGSTNTELSPHEGKDPANMLQPDDIAHAVAMLVTQTPQSFVSEVLVRPTKKP